LDGFPPSDGVSPVDGFPLSDWFPPSDELALLELQAALREISKKAGAGFENIDASIVVALSCGIGTDFLEGRVSARLHGQLLRSKHRAAREVQTRSRSRSRNCHSRGRSNRERSARAGAEVASLASRRDAGYGGRSIK
jgi:hypothetical protein